MYSVQTKRIAALILTNKRFRSWEECKAVLVTVANHSGITFVFELFSNAVFTVTWLTWFL